MAQLTWRNVEAPNFGGSAQSQAAAAALLRQGLGSLQSVIETNRQRQAQEASVGAIGALLQQSDPTAAQVLANVDPSQITPEALDFIAGNRQRVLRNEGLQLNNQNQGMVNDQLGWSNNRTRSYEANRPQAVSAMAEITSAFREGTPEGEARGRQLQQQYAPLLASAGVSIDGMMTIADNSQNAARAGLAQQEDYRTTAVTRQNAAYGQEAADLLASAARNEGVYDQASLENYLRSQNARPEVLTQALTRAAEQGPVLFGDQADMEQILLEESMRNGGAPASGSSTAQAVNRIIGVESGGDPNAQASTSSAGGLGQIVDGTWIDLVKRNRPDLANGLSDPEILAMRSDAGFNREMTTRHTEENEQVLRRANLPVNDTNRYLTHFFGSGDGPKVMKADDNARIVDIVQPASVRANPFLADMTVRQAKNWAARKMGDIGQIQNTPASSTGNRVTSDTPFSAADAASTAIDQALASAPQSVTSSNQSLVNRELEILGMGRSITQTIASDGMFDMEGALLDELSLRPNRSLQKQDVAEKIHSEIGDEDGLTKDDLTDQITRVVDKYQVPADMAGALIKNAINQNVWGTRWMQGSMGVDHEALDRFIERFVDPNATSEAERLQRSVSLMEARQAKASAANRVQELAQQAERARQALANAERQRQRRPNVDVSKPRETYQAILDKMEQEITGMDHNPLIRVNSARLTGR